MCGICGEFNFRDAIPANGEAIRRMADKLAHRGPDDEGFYISGSLGLGFRRLSIIDLGGGHQPMSDGEESVWVVFNGEIYNFCDLRKELEGRGHLFRTHSDTEVVVHGYKEWGCAVLDRLNGMFGIAIWDERKRQLMLARDRMGIKPLYYKLESGRLTFSSEIRPLLPAKKAMPPIDIVALNLFLRYRYTPSPMTIFKGIRKLAPGTSLIVREGGTPAIERWWNFKPVPFDPMPTVAQAEEELLELYERSVKRHLISDVPVGLLLSGGLDSGLLLGLMNKNGDSWRTYTVGYGKTFLDDELFAAAETARTLGGRNFPVKINRRIFEDTLGTVVGVLEEPIASASIVPMYHVCRRAREDVKVVLMGQGPDELFGGYTRHLGVHYGVYWRSVPRRVRTHLGWALSAIPRAEAIKRGLYSLDEPQRMGRYRQVLSIVPGLLVDQLFLDGVSGDDVAGALEDCWRDLEPLMDHTDELGGLQFLEVRSSLPEEQLLYADKLSMAHGLEVRVPYLDYEIVKYAERLTASFKVRNGARKWLHRRVCERFLPRQIIRRKKRGFAGNVVDEWFRSSLSGGMDEALLETSSLIYQYLRSSAVRGLLKEHRDGRRDNHKLLFSLVIVEKLLRQYSG